MVYLDIGKLLKSRNKTKYWLVKQMESSYPTINDLINNNTTSIRFETINKLCEIFECTPNDIIKYKKDK